MRRFLLIFTTLAVLASPAQALFSVLGLKNSMVQFLLEQISTEGEFEVTAEEVDEPEEGVTAIRGLKIADSEGVWFTAERLNFAWNPSRLLRGEIEFAQLSMDDVHVIRGAKTKVEADVDVEQGDKPAALISWPRSPLTLRIEGFALNRVKIDKPVLGHALAFDATGAARDEGDIQSARLDLTRTDDVSGRILLDYTRNFSDNTLALVLEADEGPNGLISALSGLPPEAASSLRLTAEGPPTDWRTELALKLAETIEADGTARVSYEGPIAVEADYRARPGPRLDPDLAALLGSEAHLKAKVAEGDDGLILIEQAELRAPDVDLTASGSYSRPTGAADLALDLAARASLAAPFDGVDFNGAGFTGRVSGAPGSYRATGDLTLDTLRTAPIDIAAASLDVDVVQEGPEDQPTTRLTIAGLTEGLRLDKIAASVIGDARLDIAAALTGDQAELARFDLASEVLKIAAAGKADLGTGDADLAFSLDTAHLAEVAGAYGVEATGTVAASGQVVRKAGVADIEADANLTGFTHPAAAAERLTITAKVRNEGERTDFDVAGNGAGLRIDRLGPEVIGPARLAAEGALDGETLTLAHALLASDLIEAGASGTVSLADNTGEITYRLDLPELGPAASRYEVSAVGSLAARGKAYLANVPRIDGRATLNGLVFDGQKHGNVTVTHDVTVGETPAGDLTLAVRDGLYGDADVKTGFRFATPLLTLTGLDARALGLAARGDVKIDTERTLAEGRLVLSSRDLRPLGRLAGTPVTGALDGTVTLSHDAGKQNADADLSGRAIGTDGATVGSLKLRARARDLTGNPSAQLTASASGVSAGGATISGLNVEGSARDLSSRPTLDLKAAVTGIETGGATITRADLTARGPLNAVALTARLTGEAEGEPLTAETVMRADLEGPALGATISKLDGTYGEHRLALVKPLRVTMQGQTVSAKGIDLILPGDGTLRGDVTKYANALAADITLNVPDLGVIGTLTGAPVEQGKLALRAKFNTSRAAGDVDVDARDLRFSNVDVAGVLGLTARGEWQGSRARLDGALSGSFGEPMSLTAEVPMRRGGLYPQLAARGPVEAGVQWQGRIDDLWALVPAAGHILTGQADIDLRVTGDIADPDLSGGVRVSEGGYQNLDLGTILTDLELATTVEPGGALGLSLDASDGAEGRITTRGSVALDASGIDLETRIERAVLVRRDDARVRLDGTLDIKGPATALAVTGRIGIDGAEIRLVNNNPPSIPDIGPVLIKGEEPPKESDDESSVTLDITVSAPGRIFVRGRGLDSEWQADLAIRGDAANPRVTGSIERVRGRLDLIGKGFDLTTGRVVFNGARQIDPQIDVVLTRTTPDLTGRVVVNGPASDPRLSFNSTPALPEDEVLPRTLFGKSSQALTPSQAISLGLGLATLMDGGGGTLDAVRSTVGLDTLRIDEDAEGNPAVATGKEVTEGVWVGTKQSIGGESGTSVVVEIDIFDNVTVDAEANPSEGSSVGVQWKKDF